MGCAESPAFVEEHLFVFDFVYKSITIDVGILYSGIVV